MPIVNPTTTELSNEIISQWFNGFISVIRIDQEMMESDVVSAATKQFYTDAITGNADGMHNYARIGSTQYFISKIVDDYFTELKAYKVALKKLALHFSEAKILVWAEIADDDEQTEKALILSEAKANAKYSANGFFVSTTIVEESDCFNMPPHYQSIILDGKLSGSHSPS
jgi:hypothetical protein